MNDLHVSALNALAVCLDDSDSILVRQLLEHTILACNVVRCTRTRTSMFGVKNECTTITSRPGLFAAHEGEQGNGAPNRIHHGHAAH